MSNEPNLNVNLAQVAAQAQAQEAAKTTEQPVINENFTAPHSVGQPTIQAEQPAQPVLPPQPIQPITDDEFVIGENGYAGPGLLVAEEATQPKEEVKPPAANDINPDTLANISSYMENMEEDFKAAEETREALDKINPNAQAVKALAEQAKTEDSDADDEDKEEEEVDPEEAAAKLDGEFQEAIVVIDKIGMGQVNFTPEEREKLEKAKKITLQETEVVDIKQFKTKKAKKNSLDSILKRQPAVHTTPIVLPASGYTATLKGASTYELISLMGSSEDALLDTETKWSTVHSKIEDTSLGKMNFNDFLRATAAIDYNMFIYGLLCATYPDDDKLPLQCANDKCKKTFEHSYSVRSLIRAEQMSDKLKELVSKTVDGSHTKEDADRTHGEAPVNQVKTVKLPVSGYVFEVYVQSAHELIYNSIKGLTENDEEKYNQASILSTVVKTAYIPDEEKPGEAFEFSDSMDITKIIFTLQSTDILVLSKQSELILDDITFEFGLMNVKCPHCGHYRETVPFDIESILFYQYQQAMNTQVE